MNIILYYIHDPMCSWCWGFKPVWKALQLHLPDSIQVEYVVGGLAPDSSIPMPVEQQAMIKAHWHAIEKNYVQSLTLIFGIIIRLGVLLLHSLRRDQRAFNLNKI